MTLKQNLTSEISLFADDTTLFNEDKDVIKHKDKDKDKDVIKMLSQF